MSEHIFLITIGLPLATLLLIFGMKYFAAIAQAKARLASDEAYRQLAAQAVAIYAELGKTLVPTAMRYGTDAGFAWQAGNARPMVLDGLGIVGDRLHSPDEWADLDSVPARLYLTVRLLETLAK